jgi:hypothetical protein
MQALSTYSNFVEKERKHIKKKWIFIFFLLPFLDIHTSHHTQTHLSTNGFTFIFIKLHIQ